MTLDPSSPDRSRPTTDRPEDLIPAPWYQMGGYRGTTSQDKVPCAIQGTTQNHKPRVLRAPFSRIGWSA